MKEKKLTDEEIAKAILQSIEYSKTITYFDEWGNCKAIMVSDILDLIKRLQDEIKYKTECYDELCNMNNEIAMEISEQKAEIERLTEEHERIAYNKQEYLEWVDGFLRTHTVMKDRGENYKMFDREWMCNIFWAKIEGSIEYIIDLENQRNELQKQVDELKDELDKAYETERANIQAEIADAGTSCHWCERQAVKDTAKEIYRELIEMEDNPCNSREEIYQAVFGKRGVEVE